MIAYKIKPFFSVVLISFFGVKSFGQGGNATNNRIENSIQISGVTNVSQVNLLLPESNSQSITYLDCLGRPIERVFTKRSPLKRDILQPIVYDNKGRMHRKYLPITGNADGSYVALSGIIDPLSGIYIGSAQSFYATPGDNIADDAKPFAQTIFDSTPLNRIAEQGFPGMAWQPGTNHTIKKNYLANTSNEVYLFNYDATSTSFTLSSNAALKYYAPNELYTIITLDEHQSQVIEYWDKKDRLVCKKVQYDTSGTTKLYAYTYYIYDDFGNLVIVVPPEAVKEIATTVGY